MQKLTYFSALAATFVLSTITACGDDGKVTPSKKEAPKVADQPKDVAGTEQPNGSKEQPKAKQPAVPPSNPADSKPVAKTEPQQQPKAESKPDVAVGAKNDDNKPESGPETKTDGAQAKAEDSESDEDLGPEPEFDDDEAPVPLKATIDDIVKGMPHLDPNMTNTTPITPPWEPGTVPSNSPVAAPKSSGSTPTNPPVTSNDSGSAQTNPPSQPVKNEAVLDDTNSTKTAHGRFKIADRSLGHAWIETQKDLLLDSDLDIEDGDFYVRCQVAGHKPIHMLATSGYLGELQNRGNLKPTDSGFTWTQIEQDGTTFDFDCVAYSK